MKHVLLKSSGRQRPSDRLLSVGSHWLVKVSFAPWPILKSSSSLYIPQNAMAQPCGKQDTEARCRSVRRNVLFQAFAEVHICLAGQKNKNKRLKLSRISLTHSLNRCSLPEFQSESLMRKPQDWSSSNNLKLPRYRGGWGERTFKGGYPDKTQRALHF